MNVSIIIVNYKSAELAVNCISSIKQFTHGIDYEVIVVDNNSEDNSEQILKGNHPDIVWVQTGYNAGFSRGNNAGFRVAKGDYLLLLNADTLLFENTIALTFNRLQERKDIAVIAGLQVNPDLSLMPYFRNRNEFRKFLYVVPNRFNKYLDKFFSEPHFSDPNQAELPCGAFMMMSRETIEKVGAMDEDFFMYAEDFEWAGRLRKAGKLCYFDDIRFIHLEKPSPFRRTNITPINKFGTQMQVSNLLWIRKEYGISPYLFLIFHYVTLAIAFYAWKITVNIINFRNPFFQLRSQKIFGLKVLVFLKFFWKTLFKIKGFYKIAEADNIDVRFK
ncbi:glycosyltransferase family 2 protein [Arcicella sp. LKC2W]|uniref:glycosyltransferase family 2 protein n=1 Tax=Arcicella sp. LKC2W TaxID=2984198 RepID=UPI002B1F0930|nr:glycosyltransferase family 2 protein [Arcicella sp. LKC2W]MEA5457727.1 glycosyltransferase family 2 protein [Arcicella sp. LKC2W]